VTGVVDYPPASGGIAPDEPPPARYAQVVVYLSDTSQPDGTTSPVALVAQGSTDANGNFSLSAADTAAMDSLAASNGGLLNFDVVSNLDGYEYLVPITRTYSAGQWLDEDGAVPAPVSVTSMGGPDKFNNTPTTAGSESPSGSYGYSGCDRQRTVLSTTTASTVIGELHNALDVTSTFSYGVRADSSIQRAVSADGTVWKIGGSLKIGNDNGESAGLVVTQNAPSDNWGHELLSQFRYGKVKITMACGSPGSIPIVWDTYEIDALKWMGGITPGPDVSVFDHHCSEATTTIGGKTYHFLDNKAIFGPDSATTRDSNRYGTFTNAASVTFGGLTLSLDARSGMSRWVKQHWTFGHAIQEHWLCGDNNDMSHASHVYAGA
jgi:hypothetical protein